MALQSRATLLLTRPIYAAQRFASEARAHLKADFGVVISPLMAPDYLSPDLPETPPKGVIFTSETGVAALNRLVEWRVPAICVGPRTTEAALETGWPAECLGGDAEGLVAALLERRPEGQWLHARGQDAAGQLATRLNAGGLTVLEPIVYAQNPCPLTAEARALFDGPAPVILPIFSPRSGRLLLRELGAPGAIAAPLHIVAISLAAAETIRPLATSTLEIANTPDGPGMLEALARLKI